MCEAPTRHTLGVGSWTTSPDIVVVMGVSGAGKSTIGRHLAERRDVTFVEGDRLHPPANIERMALGEPLDDDARRPWLDAIATEIGELHQRGTDAVIACSALRRVHRDRLRGAAPIRFVFLAATPSDLARRVDERNHEFMPPGLLADQLATLESPAPDEDDVVEVAPRPTIEATVEAVEAALGPPRRTGGTLDSGAPG